MTAAVMQFMALVGNPHCDSFEQSIANTLDELAPDDVQVSVLGSIGSLPQCFSQGGSKAPDAVIEMGSAIEDADALIIVTTEHNSSVPGALKNALDWLGSLQSRPLAGKPTAVQTTSTDMRGGIRAHDHLLRILETLDATVLSRPEITVPHVARKVDGDTGSLTDDETRLRIRNQLTSLARLVGDRQRR